MVGGGASSFHEYPSGRAVEGNPSILRNRAKSLKGKSRAEWSDGPLCARPPFGRFLAITHMTFLLLRGIRFEGVSVPFGE